VPSKERVISTENRDRKRGVHKRNVNTRTGGQRTVTEKKMRSERFRIFEFLLGAKERLRLQLGTPQREGRAIVSGGRYERKTKAKDATKEGGPKGGSCTPKIQDSDHGLQQAPDVWRGPATKKGGGPEREERNQPHKTGHLTVNGAQHNKNGCIRGEGEGCRNKKSSRKDCQIRFL